MRPPTGPGASRSMDGTSPEMWGDSTAQEGGPGRGGWLKDSRFAMFVHWGLYSELAGEWQGKRYFGIAEWIMNRARIPAREYERVAERFNPVGFDALEWVRLAKAAGMRHIMVTAKHHDGFAMFRSAVSPYNIVDATPFGRDPILELAEACREEGLRLGVYYSQTADWHHPDGVGNSWDTPPPDRDFRRYLHGKAMPQIEELLTNYGPLAGIWFDTPGPITPDESRDLVDLVHRLQPECLVNSRIGNGLGDYDTLGDQEIPRFPRPGLWETPDTHNDSWSYSRFDANWKSAREIAERLVRVVARGGTYLLNVGPDGKGRIPEPSVRALREVGEWLRTREDGIHGATPTPFGPLAWGDCTVSGSGRTYLHVFHWPSNGRLLVPGLRSAVEGAALVGGGQLETEAGEDALVVRLPESRPQNLVPAVALDLAAPVVAERIDCVFTDCPNTLEPAMAEKQGCQLQAVRWMEKFGDWKHAECLGEWNPEGSEAAWEFRTFGAASLHLLLEYTCPEEADYSAWSVEVAGTELVFPLIDTGERPKRAAFGGAFPRFRTCRIGLVELPGPGCYRLSLRPLDGGTARIAAVVLEPAG